MNTNYQFTPSSFALLQSLMDRTSPSMCEGDMRVFLQTQLEEHGMHTETDIMENIHASYGLADAVQIALVAHMDTVALQISSVLPSGMATCRFIGLRPHVALGQPLKVLTRNGIIDAVVGFDTTSQYGQPKGLIEEDLWIDFGTSSKEDTLRLVEIGDMAVLNQHLTILNDDYISGGGLDDRIGLLILLEVAKQVISRKIPAGLHLYGTVQEEIGLRGANVILQQKTSPKACFVIDVDYATDIPTGHGNQSGELSLGNGAGLHVKADNSPILRELACSIANKYNIPIQKTIGRFMYGGTDASPIQLSNVPVINVNIPCRYMHSPIEICHISDIQSAVNLLVETINALATEPHDLIPR